MHVGLSEQSGVKTTSTCFYGDLLVILFLIKLVKLIN